MTINELDQGIRNLIASQPMVTTGMNADVIGGINALIDAYRNLSFRIQSYPCQDVMKFGLTNEFAKLETTFTGMALQVLQERGINLMLYIPRTGAQYGPMVNGYGMINTNIDPNVMLGQMAYNQPMGAPMGAPVPMMQMPNTMIQPGAPMGAPAYNPMQPNMSGVGTQNFGNQRMAPKRNTPTFPGYAPNDRPIKVEPVVQNEQAMKTRSAPQSKIKAEPKPNPVASVVRTAQPAAPVAEAPVPEAPVAAPSPAEMLMGAADNDSKAKGRDYLMELLKK